MRRRYCLLSIAAAGCAPTADQQAAALSVDGPATAIRSRQSRRFDTADQNLLLGAAVGVLQDLGYTVQESRASLGLVVGTKSAPSRIRAQLVVGPAPDRRASVARVTFQDVSTGRPLDDTLLYQGFFDRLAQSVFLTAHGI